MVEKRVNTVFRITPINPFTDRGAEIIERVANGMSHSEIASELGIAKYTVKNHITGQPDSTGEKSRLGVLGIIEKYKGIRPSSLKTAIPGLVGDILLFDKNETTS